jgi:probable HAF family extracellular repeat protein
MALACGGSSAGSISGSTAPAAPDAGSTPAAPDPGVPDSGTPPAADAGTPDAGPGAQLAPVDPLKELVIVDSSAMLDQRASNAAGGAWSFRKTMERLGQRPEPWLQSFHAASIGGRAVDDRPKVDALISSWPRAADGSLDLAKAPFRLVAIAARLDLSTSPNGEGRFIYGLVDPVTGAPGLMTVAFEFALPSLGTSNDRQAWAAKFHALGALPFGETYNAALQSLTDQFAAAGNLAQVRTNEAAFGAPWELRQWALSNGALTPTWTAVNPDQSLDGAPQLAQFVIDNQAEVMAGTVQLPQSMLAGTSLETGAWRFPEDSRIDEPVRHAFAIQTCNGCHAAETFSSQGFFHVNPLKKIQGDGRDRLSQFLLSSELPRRADHLARLVAGLTEAGTGAPTALPPLPQGAPQYDVLEVPAPEDGAPVAMASGRVLGNSAAQGPWLYDGAMHFLLQGDARQPIALGFNATGEVVGYFAADNRAFVLSGQGLTELTTLGGGESQASLVNASGVVAGESAVTSGTHHGFVWSGGTMRDVGGLGGGETFPFALSAGGLMTGESQLDSGVFQSHAFVWNAGTMTDLGTLGGNYSRGQTIDDSGFVTGFSTMVPSDEKVHAFTASGGAMVDLGSAPGLPWSAVTGRNSSGVMIGNLYDVPTPTAQIFTVHSFVSFKGALLDLNSLTQSPRILSSAISIDDAGHILCTDGQVGQAKAHALLLTPR